MGKRTRIVGVALVVAAIAGLGYVTYVGAEGSNRLVEGTERGDCRTPDVHFGWGYEAINYDIADDAKLQTIAAGGYAALPAEMRHFFLAKSAATFQVHGTGPFVVNYVNPADDPQKKK